MARPRQLDDSGANPDDFGFSQGVDQGGRGAGQMPQSPDYVPGGGGLGEGLPYAIEDIFGEAGRHGEGPRGAKGTTGGNDVQLRGMSAGPSPGAPANAAPRRPSTPTPMAGSVAPPAGPQAPSSGVVPFQPMASPNVGSMATPRLRGLYGSMGGLQGGGLGVPLDPMSDQTSDPISSLLQLLQKDKGLV